MALDNPSYFSVISEKNNAPQKAAPGSTSSSSQSSLSRQLTPPRGGFYGKPSIGAFLRSASLNSADSNQDLFIRGEPRLADIAPELLFSQKRQAHSKPSSHDLIYSAVPTSEDAIVSEPSDEEVFVSEDSARYYNIGKNPNSDSRRHSISSFATRERTASIASTKSFHEDIPEAIVHATLDGDSPVPLNSIAVNIDDHALRHGSYPRKRCNLCTKKPFIKREDMDDILIISLKQSAAAALWVDYFNTYFSHMCEQAKRKPFRIHHLGAEEVIDANPVDITEMQQRSACVKLQLIVVCPSLLDYISWKTTTSRFGKLIIPDRTLALLLGVSDDSLNEIHKKTLTTYFQWQRLSVGQDEDENFTKEFLGTAVSILSRVWKQQISTGPLQKSQISVLPKKVRQGHSSIVIILTHPLKNEDIVKVSVERNNQIIEVKSVKRRNPYTLKLTIPDSCTEVSAIVHILVEKNGSIIGSSPVKCESRLRELEQILHSTENPMEFMCQALGFSPSNKEHMDSCLAYSFQKNIPPNFNLLTNQASSLRSNMYMHRHGREEYPTLLHFAARYGLEKLAMKLLECPGGDAACDIRNMCDLTPAEIAQNAGHTDLAHILSGYMKMNEFKIVYEKLKEMSLETGQNNGCDEESGYLTPNSFDCNAYKLCPPPKPVEIFTRQQSETTEEALSAQSSTEHLQSSIIIKPDLTTNLHTVRNTSENEAITTPLQQNIDMSEDKVQTELLEIINDFKNNVHSISQVEKLVEEWKNRNDVQLSFKEKHEQLNEMRLRYEKIQQDMKTNMKKATPFERVRKLLFKGKSKINKTETNVPVSTTSMPTASGNVTYTTVQTTKRPISSLSLHSTSSSESSGRTSTISACSVGDSGTHSDHEERKNALSTTPDDEFRNELNKAIINLNYMVPPPPKPFNPVNKFLAKSTPFPTIEERPHQQTPPPSNDPTCDAYYIQFPPSGLPVQGMEFLKPSAHEKMPNLDYQNKEETECNKNYMNVNVNILHTKERQDLGTEEFHEYINYKLASLKDF